MRDFVDILILNGILSQEDRERSAGLKRILAVYANTRMHGTEIAVEDGLIATLHAGFANKDRLLEVKVNLGYTDWIKPVQVPICIFLSSLKPEGSCDPALIGNSDPTMWNAWSCPLEMRLDGILAAMA